MGSLVYGQVAPWLEGIYWGLFVGFVLLTVMGYIALRSSVGDKSFQS